MQVMTSGALASRARGFNLVELMVTVAIVALLAAIAYPGYRAHVVKTQRGAAQACLAQYAAQMERHYTTSMTYATPPSAPGCAVEGNMPDNYTFSVINVTATTYTAQAVPTSGFAARDTQCGTLSMNHLGQKAVSPGDLADCWR